MFGIVGQTENAMEAIEVLRLAVIDDGPLEEIGKARRQVGMIALQDRNRLLGDAKRRRKISLVEYVLDLAQKGRHRDALLLQPFRAQQALGGRRLRGEKPRVDAGSHHGGEREGKAMIAETLPIVAGTLVVVVYVGDQAAQKQLPFKKRRLQADALHRFTCSVVAAGIVMAKRLLYDIEACMQVGGQAILASRPL